MTAGGKESSFSVQGYSIRIFLAIENYYCVRFYVVKAYYVVIGSELSGGYKNLFVEDCEMDSPSLERVIRMDLKNVLNINLLNCSWTNVKENNRLEGLAFRNTTINGEMVK